MFVNGWSCTARGDCETVAPHFELSTLFPWRDDTNDIEKESQATEGDYDHEKDNKIVTKRFVFNATDIARLRDKARKVESPTRIEVLRLYIGQMLKKIFSSLYGFYSALQKSSYKLIMKFSRSFLLMFIMGFGTLSNRSLRDHIWLSICNWGHDLESLEYLVGMRCVLSGEPLISFIRDVLGTAGDAASYDQSLFGVVATL
ncbi:hypothetical protein Syun_024400 [Stephania yunnanensis]|uniref:Uncharacterized protein n=1 Tax=Stephania yunnanensis TaxID=152371 RepID=A0AAP0I4C5_9MAGN